MRLWVAISLFTLLAACTDSRVESSEASTSAAEVKVDSVSGLAEDPNLPLVVSNCTACHSSKLITQNRASREGWKNMIRWMQETQKLWDLGANEAPILDYLVRYYSPDNAGSRRSNLEGIEWYELKAEE